MDNIQTLTDVAIKVQSGYRDSFYVKEKNGKYFIGHCHGLKAGETHEVTISKEFYDSFLLEQTRQQYKIK